MKRLVLWAVLSLFLTIQLGFSQSSIDFGGTITNNTGITSTNELLVSQSNGIDFWFSTQSALIDFLIQGAYSYAYDQSGEPALQHLPDVQSLRLKGNIPTDNMGMSRFSFSLGRFAVQDHTRNIVGQALDGFSLGFNYPLVAVTASFGTSILPNKKSGAIILSKADIADYGDETVFMGAPRVVGIMEAVFPSVLRQRLTISGVFQEDLRPLFESRSANLITEGQTTVAPASGGTLDTQYVGLGVKGNIVSGLFYDLHFTLGTGRTLSYITPEDSVSGSYEYTQILGMMGGAGLSLYLPKVLSTVAGLNFIMSSGDEWSERASYTEGSTSSSSMLFIPVTAKPLATVFTPSLGNIMAITASYSLKPLGWLGLPIFDQLQTAIKGIMFVRYAAGPLSVAVPNSDSTDAYLGSEIDLQVSFRPFSDLGFSFSGGMFFPNAAAGGPFDTADTAGSQTKMQITASFSF